MGNLKIIFETDQELIDSLEAAGTLENFESRVRYEGVVEDVKARRFNTSEGYKLKRLGSFVSRNYQAHYGDFSDFNHPALTEEKFGPEPVFGINVNTGDRGAIEGKLKQAVEELEKRIPDARKRLSYVGILYEDHYGIIFKDERREEITPLIWSENP